MEKYKKSLVYCCVKLAVLSSFLIAVYLVFATPILQSAFPFLQGNPGKDMHDVLRGALCGFLAVQIFYTVSILRIIKNPDKLAMKFRKTHDERELLIKQSTGSFTSIGTMYTLVIAAIIAGAYSSVVSYTIFAILILILVLYFGANLYYLKKY